MPTATLEKYMTTAETAEILNLKEHTLRVWRTTGKGPRFVRIEGAVRYRPSDVQAYLDRNTSPALALV